MVALSGGSPMNHLSSLFSPKLRKSNTTLPSSSSASSSRSSSSRKGAVRRLDRTKASRYTDYFPEGDSDRSSSAGTNAFDDLTSFRINGAGDWEVSSLCEILGLSGPEDFAVDLESWRRSRSRTSSSSTSNPNCPLPPVPAAKAGEEAVGGGIKGARPPMLAPPPYVSSVVFPTVEDLGRSAWDLVKSLGLQGVQECAAAASENEVKGLEEEEEDVSLIVHRGRGDATTSCSFTTVNDDDCSSTTTEGLSLSPSSGRCCRWQIGAWTQGKELGRGSFGTVYEAISEDGRFFAVKEVLLLNQLCDCRQSIEQLEQEIILLSQFEHENIVRYIGTEKKEDKFYIFLELVTQGSLVSLYNKYHLQDSQVSAYTWQLLHGLQYLHERNVVHRDVKCANILVDASGSAKLADFGLAKQVSRVEGLKSCKGSIYWMAPEVVKPVRGYGPPADIWSLGCTVLEMLTRKPPYVSEHRPSSGSDWVNVIYSIGMGVKPNIPEYISDNARDFINQCIQVNPDDRPTAGRLLDHPFVKRQSYTFASPSSPFRRQT